LILPVLVTKRFHQQSFFHLQPIAWLKAGYPIDRKVATQAMPSAMVCPECGAPLESHPSHEP